MQEKKEDHWKVGTLLKRLPWKIWFHVGLVKKHLQSSSLHNTSYPYWTLGVVTLVLVRLLKTWYALRLNLHLLVLMPTPPPPHLPKTWLSFHSSEWNPVCLTQPSCHSVIKRDLMSTSRDRRWNLNKFQFRHIIWCMFLIVQLCIRKSRYQNIIRVSGG